MVGTVEAPFSPSGVVGAVRKYKPVGMERYIDEISSAIRTALRSGENVLIVVIAPYGWGKSELLDELANTLEGFEVTRTVLIPGRISLIEKIRTRRDEEKPFLLLVDEADEITRMVELQKLGALNDDKFREMLLSMGREIRAILEPRSHLDLLGNIRNVRNVALIMAVTPQLYYTVLKNMLPDIFDVARGRVYKEVKLDERIPLWLFHEMVKSRLRAYGQENLFTLSDISAVYHIAMRIERNPSPRLLVKLMFKLYQYKKYGNGILDLVKEPDIAGLVKGRQADPLLPYVLAGIPIPEIPGEYHDSFHRVNVVKIPFDDKEALRALNDVRLRNGLLPLPTRDVYDASFAPFDYYTMAHDGTVYLYVALPDVPSELQQFFDHIAYIPNRALLKAVFADDDRRDLVERTVRHVTAKFESADIHELVEDLVEIAGARVPLSHGKATIQNRQDMRLGLVTLYVLNEHDFESAASTISAIIDRGTIADMPVDSVIIFLLSNTLLSSILEEKVSPLLQRRWKSVYRDPAHVFAKLFYYGADRIERLRDSIVFSELRKVYGDENPYSEHAQTVRDIINDVAAHVESARRALYRYTLAIRRNKEGKGAALRRIVSAWLQDQCVDQPNIWCGDGGKPSLSLVEESFYEYLTAVDAHITQKTLEREIRRLYPVHLWRDFKEDDLIHIMVLRGLLVPCGTKVYKPFPYAEDCARKFLESIIAEIRSLENISIDLNTHLGIIRLSERVPMEIGDVPIATSSFKSLSSAIISLTEKRDIIARIHEEKRRELSAIGKNIVELTAKVRVLDRLGRLTHIRDAVQSHLDRQEYGLAISLLKNEAIIAEKVDEALRIFHDYKDDLNMDENELYEDLNTILSMPQPLSLIDAYIRDLRLIAEELRTDRISRLESLRKEAEETETMVRWVRRRLGIDVKHDKKTLLKVLSEKAHRMGVDPHLMIAIARLGYNTGIDVERLATELGIPKNVVMMQLEKLVEMGVVEKKYVA